MHPINSDHVINISKFLKMLAQSVHRFSQLGTLLSNFPGRFDDLLVQYLIAIGEVSHARAEDHRIWVHVNSDLALFSDELDDRLAIFGFLEDLVRFLEFFQIFNLEEVIETNRGFELFTTWNCLQEASELFLALSEEFLCHFIIFDGQRRYQHMRKLRL